MKSIGIIRPATTQTIEAEGATFDEAKSALEALVPEGWQLLAVRYER